MSAPWSESTFEEHLRDVLARRYHHIHPFNRRMHEGRLSPEQIRGWIANRFYYQENLPRKDASILANCPDREVRRRWVQRILDHDGMGDAEGGIEAWLRLAEAVMHALTPAEHAPASIRPDMPYGFPRFGQFRRQVLQLLWSRFPGHTHNRRF